MVMMSSLEADTVPSAPQPRQRPGAACEGCRRRKLRCDGQRPRCTYCREHGIVCEVNVKRPTRGPQKGALKALQNRVGECEISMLCSGQVHTLSDFAFSYAGG